MALIKRGAIIPTWNSMGASGRQSGVEETVADLRMARSSPERARMLPAGTSCRNWRKQMVQMGQGSTSSTCFCAVLPGMAAAHHHTKAARYNSSMGLHCWDIPNNQQLASPPSSDPGLAPSLGIAR